MASLCKELIICLLGHFRYLKNLFVVEAQPRRVVPVSVARCELVAISQVEDVLVDLLPAQPRHLFGISAELWRHFALVTQKYFLDHSCLPLLLPNAFTLVSIKLRKDIAFVDGFVGFSLGRVFPRFLLSSHLQCRIDFARRDSLSLDRCNFLNWREIATTFEALFFRLLCQILL